MKRARSVSCPRCGAEAKWSPENRYRPFCSERCKLIDLGAWATEKYRFPLEDEERTPDAGAAEQESETKD